MTSIPICITEQWPQPIPSTVEPLVSIAQSGRALISSNGFLWRNGSTLRVGFLDYSQATRHLRRKVQQIAVLWLDYANLKMEFLGALGNVDSDIRVGFEQKSSWSYIGTQSKAIHRDAATINFAFTDTTEEWYVHSTILHEFGHALGLVHEHQSPEGGIRWNREAVYAYYDALDWPKWRVDHNIFTTYDRDITKYSAFDPYSIMVYYIPAEHTLDGFSTKWSTTLSVNDKIYISELYPGKYGGGNTLPVYKMGSFNTCELYLGDPRQYFNSKRITLDGALTGTSAISVGLNWLDMSYKSADGQIAASPARSRGNPRIKAFITNDTNDITSQHINIESWADTLFYAGGCSWLAVEENNRKFQIGSFDTTAVHTPNNPQPQTSRYIKFNYPYASPPKVVVWLNKLSISQNANWRVNTYASIISGDGFEIHIDTWSGSKLYEAGASWIAYPADQANVSSGRVSTYNTSRYESFRSRAFTNASRVVMGFSLLDIGCRNGLRVKAYTSDVTTKGMKWHIDSWGDTKVHAAECSYIALP